MPDDLNYWIKRAEWSDAFFNYIPAEFAYDDGNDALLVEAGHFVEAFPQCPMSPNELVQDFLKRV